MTDSRWLQELTNSYINNSAGVPSNINEELINEQAEYISELEDIVISIAESLEVSVEDLMELTRERMIGLKGAVVDMNAGKKLPAMGRGVPSTSDKARQEYLAAKLTAKGVRDVSIRDGQTVLKDPREKWGTKPVPENERSYMHPNHETLVPTYSPITKETPVSFNKGFYMDERDADAEIKKASLARRAARLAKARKDAYDAKDTV